MEPNQEEPIKKKRGRKKKSELLAISEKLQESTTLDEPVLKKRGRKPKGGKLVSKETSETDSNISVANVILHLKCSMDDMTLHNNTMYKQYVNDPLEYNPVAPPVVSNYDTAINSFSLYDPLLTSNTNNLEHTDSFENKLINTNICNICNQNLNSQLESNDEDETDNISMKDINLKLKEIKLQLYKSEYPDKKVACFWCTYDYDNPACYIPRYDIDNVIYGYGSFCRPECGAAYLMKENIDDSVKFERYHMLNQIYGKVYNYKNNIKPAPNPYYLLDKYYGNLSIQEYRKLLKSEHMLLVIDRPMTRILPELHEETEDFINNCNKQHTGSNSGVYKVKRQSEKKKGPSKTEIIKETFGL
jgi:hypothetical protein|tara:strand:- start:3770 stop:4846 length:1077 start_codon:yes stop_codon:yes gene_type:complete